MRDSCIWSWRLGCVDSAISLKRCLRSFGLERAGKEDKLILLSVGCWGVLRAGFFVPCVLFDVCSMNVSRIVRFGLV